LLEVIIIYPPYMQLISISMKTLDDLPAGESWATRFKTTTFLDDAGQPITAENLAIGQAHPGAPGEYEGIGVISTRDSAKQLVRVTCISSGTTHVVNYADCWAWDRVEVCND